MNEDELNRLYLEKKAELEATRSTKGAWGR